MVWRFRLKPSRSDGDVSARGNGGKEALGFFNGRGEIGVSEHNDFTERLEHAGADAVTFATIAGILEQTNLRMRGGKGADHIGRGVEEPSLTTITSADHPR